MPAMMNSIVETHPTVIPGPAQPAPGIHGAAFQPVERLRGWSLDSGSAFPTGQSVRNDGGVRFRKKSDRRVKHGMKQCGNGAPHLGIFGLKQGKSPNAKGANGAPLLPAKAGMSSVGLSPPSVRR